MLIIKNIGFGLSLGLVTFGFGFSLGFVISNLNLVISNLGFDLDFETFDFGLGHAASDLITLTSLLQLFFFNIVKVIKLKKAD